MTAEHQVNPNIYPSSQSGKVEYIAILPNGKRLSPNQSQFLKLISDSPDKTSFSSQEFHDAVRPGQDYAYGSVHKTMSGLTKYFTALGGSIIPSGYKPGASYTYDVFLPEDARAGIQIQTREVPVSHTVQKFLIPTFHLPNDNVVTARDAVLFHELIKDRLSFKSAITTDKLFALVYGYDTPYSVDTMNSLLSRGQQKLEGTDIVIEKRINRRVNEKGRSVRTYSSVFLNLSGYIDKLKAETAELQIVEEAAKDLSYPASTYKAAKKVTDLSFTNFSHARQLADHLLGTLLYRHIVAVSAQYFSDRVSFHLDKEEFMAFGFIAQKYAQSLLAHPRAQQFLQEKGPYLLTAADFSILDTYVDPAVSVEKTEDMLKRIGYRHIAGVLHQPLQWLHEAPQIKRKEPFMTEGEYLYEEGRGYDIYRLRDLNIEKLLEDANLEELAGWDFNRLRQLYNTLSGLVGQRFAEEIRYSDLGLVVHPIQSDRMPKLIFAENQKMVIDACQLVFHLYQAKKKNKPFQALPQESEMLTFGNIYEPVKITLKYYQDIQEKNPGKPLNMKMLTLAFLRQTVPVK